MQYATSREPLQETFHAMPLAQVEESVQGREDGLSSDEASKRLQAFGRNELPEAPPVRIWEVILHQFKSPLIYILCVAAGVSLLIGDYKDASFIAVVLVLNAAIGSYQEWSAEQSNRALKKLLRIRATVMRDGEVVEIGAEEIVPGDRVWLESGNRVPADMRLVSTQSLEVDESLLTGESMAVSKDAMSTGTADTPVADRHNMAHAGSIVVRGRGKGLVVGTGTRTVVGQLAQDVLGAEGGVPPLIERMERFSKTVAIAVLLAVIAIGVFGVVRHGYAVGEMFMFAVALAVAAIPEGLPVALTVALSVATNRMAQRKVIVRRLAAVEGLGSCTLIASDKTGTLTCNELTVQQLILADGSAQRIDTSGGFSPEQSKPLRLGDEREGMREALLRAGVLCNEATVHRHDNAWISRGDPTDIALLKVAMTELEMSREELIASYPEVGSIPFEPERRYAATLHQLKSGETRVVVKGAPERVLAMCVERQSGPSVEELRERAVSMAEQGYRVLALAEGQTVEDLGERNTSREPSNLSFVGFVGMIDPPRPGVHDAIRRCHEAGIQVCMITGDHPVTALAISRGLGLAERPEQVITGSELEGRSIEDLRNLIGRIKVFARVAPRQKLELVRAAQEAGHYVAVTGDGVNDAPALRIANIGVAMGKDGTDVAREAASLVISDDNFASIMAGVEEGRVAYDNVRKVIYLLVSTGAAEVLILGLAVFAGMPLPLLPAQILWLNLVTNGIQDIALAFEPNEGDVLTRPPRSPRERVFNRVMIERVIVAAVVMTIGGFGAFNWMLLNGWSEAESRNGLLLLMVLFELVHIGNCRSETKSAFRLSLFRSPVLLTGSAAALFIHVVAMHTALGQRLLGVAPVSFETWLWFLVIAAPLLLASEMHKLAYNRYQEKRSVSARL